MVRRIKATAEKQGISLKTLEERGGKMGVPVSRLIPDIDHEAMEPHKVAEDADIYYCDEYLEKSENESEFELDMKRDQFPGGLLQQQ